MTTLADARSKLAFDYDVVVVGSGYGGAVLAARLAERGKRVCLLERGREWTPGDFPTDEKSLASAVRTPLNPLGLIDPNAQIANDMDVVVACGLGGTSLINAGISLVPSDEVFEQPEWPSAIRRAHEDGSLAPFFERALAMLGARRVESLADAPKVRRHKQAVEGRGKSHDTLTLNVSQACTSCGDCVAGCNVGAKNATTTNYLPLAKRHHARIFTGIEVLSLEPDHGDAGWVVHFKIHDTGEHHGTVRAPIVVLGAGATGSTEILLRSETDHFGFSKRLGDRFSANADVMGMSYNGRERTSAIAQRGVVGTTISSYGDYRAAANWQERFLLLEGALPSPLVTLVARAIGTYALTRAREMNAEQRARTMRDLVPLTTPGVDGALGHSMLYLACGHDSASGRLVLAKKDARVHVVWPDASKERWVSAIEGEMEAHAHAHGAIFVRNPRSTILGGGRQMTVHPLGGCPMGDDVDHGAVDDLGRVFARDGGVHRGLYVADGAIIPRSLGVTPLLTISALAERVASRVE
jgi:cholesterol oxidase